MLERWGHETHNYVYHMKFAILSPKKNGKFIMYSEHVTIIGHYLWSVSTNFSKYVNASLLYVLSNMYTMHWTTKVSPITNSYIHVLGSHGSLLLLRS